MSAELDLPEPSEPRAPTTQEAADPTFGPWYGDLQLVARERVAAPPPPKPKPERAELPPPTAEELEAWDRLDPEGEAQLHAWDQAHVAELSNWWRELQCFRLAVVSVGNRSYNDNDAERWQAFMIVFAPVTDGWINAALGSQPEILSNSKLIGPFLEVHELLSGGYPRAFEAGDAYMLEELDLSWARVSSKIDDRFTRMSASAIVLDLAACRSWLDTFG